MNAAEIARQMAHYSARLISAAEASDATRPMVLSHISSTLGSLGTVMAALAIEKCTCTDSVRSFVGTCPGPGDPEYDFCPRRRAASVPGDLAITPAPAEQHTVGIAVSAWLRGYRDAFPVHSIRWYTIDELLDDYQGLLGAAEEMEAP